MEKSTFVIRLGVTPKELIGPLAIAEVFEGLQKNEISWTDLGFQPGQSWLRLYEFTQLRMLMDNAPHPMKLDKYAKLCMDHLEAHASTDKVDARQPEAWPAPTPKAEPGKASPAQALPPRYSAIYLSVQGIQKGPMNGEEARTVLKEMKSRDQVYLWYRGLKTWFPVQELPEFADLSVGKSRLKKIPEEITNAIFSREHRQSDRKSIVATIRERGLPGKELPQGVCMNISATGIQVRFEDRCPYGVGDVVEFEMTPLRTLDLPVMTFRAKVMWVKPDECRVGFAFLQFRGDGQVRLNDFLARLKSGRPV